MSKQLDARGLSCPQPVLMSKKAIKEGHFPIEVLVDTVASCDNIRRMVTKEKLKIEIEKLDDDFKITIQK